MEREEEDGIIGNQTWDPLVGFWVNFGEPTTQRNASQNAKESIFQRFLKMGYVYTICFFWGALLILGGR